MRTISDELDYYALRVAPMKEQTCVRILEQRHVLATYPTREFERRVHRNSKKKITIERPVLHGYVFVGFEQAIKRIPWDKVLSLHIVTKVLNLNGVPLVFRNDDLRRLFSPDQFHAEERAKARRAYTLKDRVRVLTGPFGGFEGKITAMTDEELFVAMQLMGREVPLRLTFDQVRKVAA